MRNTLFKFSYNILFESFCMYGVSTNYLSWLLKVDHPVILQGVIFQFCTISIDSKIYTLRQEDSTYVLSLDPMGRIVICLLTKYMK